MESRLRSQSASADDKLSRLLGWCRRSGITVDPRLSIVHDAASGYSVRAAAAIAAGDLVVQVPKVALLSVRTSSLPAPGSGDAALDLALCLVHERRLGPRSRFHAYLDTLPTRVALPPQSPVPGPWPWQWIAGTEAERILAHTRNPMRVADDPTLQDALSVVSSRAFLVDPHHGLSLVPICDLFNHTEMHNVHFESDHDDHAALATATVDMRVLHPAEAGDELYNTYGPLSNAELLLRYGFCLEDETRFERSSFSPPRPPTSDDDEDEDEDEDDDSLWTEHVHTSNPDAQFIDNEGRPSLGFLRSFLSNAKVNVLHSLLACQSESAQPDREVRDGLNRAEQTVRERRAAMFIASREQEALDVLETAPPGPLRSCILHAYQEFAALRAAEHRLAYLATLFDQ